MSRLAWFTLIGLLAASPVFAQSNPLRGDGAASEAAQPDQPVQPNVPVLVPRAQPQPAAPPAPEPPFRLTQQEEAQVDRVLNRWEERNRQIKTFDCRFKRWVYDVVFGSPDQPKYIDLGMIRYEAPNRGLFRTEETEQNGKTGPIEDGRAEHWICDGQSIFDYNHTKKLLTEHKLPQELLGKAIADSPLPFLFCSEAQKLKQRYFIRIVTPSDKPNEIWLEAYPRHQQDAANFHHAQFIVGTQDMTPLGLVLVQPNNKDHTSYFFYDVVINDPLRLFKGDPYRASTPSGWKKIVEETPQAAAQARRQ